MNYFLILLASLISLISNSQELLGRINNSKIEEAISFVNVGVLNENRGTVSDINGKFRLTLDSSLVNDSLRLTCIGYSSKSYSIKELIAKSSNQGIVEFRLTPREYQIQEVTIKAKKAKITVLGNPIRDNNRCRLRTDSQLGSEMGLIIRLPKKNKRYLLKDFTFNLADHDFETEVRVNIYDLKNSLPAENILREPIIITIPSNKEILTIDLLKYNIEIDHDFFISIEHFKKNLDMDKRLKFNCISAKNSYSECYSRKVSQGVWTNIKHVGVQFKVRVYVQ